MLSVRLTKLSISQEFETNSAMESIDKKLALVLWGKDESGEDDVVVFAGILREINGSYFLERNDGSDPEIKQAWLDRIKQIPEDIKSTLLDCEYQLSLAVDNLDGSSADYEKYGLVWPK